MRILLQNIFLKLEALFDRLFGPAWNPIRQLGTLAFFLFWVAAATGIYVYILFDTSVAGAFPSVQRMTEQWYFAGVMRSLHRYASDAMVATALLHLVREFIFDRYRGIRWFAWITGIPILLFLFTSGISGYWLVWDQLAQYVAIGSMEWLDVLGIFGKPVANNFLTPDSINDRFFSLLVFVHIFVPLFLLFIMWMHVLRLSRPRINPPRGLAISCLIMLVVLSLAKPAISHAPANLEMVPTILHLDWFYMLFYPLFDEWGAKTLWVVTGGVVLIFAALPWIPPLKQPKAASVNLDKCNGCARCFDDCPYGAITMMPRSDGLPFEREAIVDPSVCSRCGVCVGACPVSSPFRQLSDLESAIEMPDYSLANLRTMIDQAQESLKSSSSKDESKVIVVGCDHSVDTKQIKDDRVVGVQLPCIGMLPPSFIDYMLSEGGFDGVVLSGCREGGCYHRLGLRWTQERIAGLRDPYLRKRVPRERLLKCWASRTETTRLQAEIDAFKTSLKEHKVESVEGGR